MENLGSIPGLGRSPGEGNGYPLQYSSLENSIGRGAWQAAVHGVSESWTQLKQLNTQQVKDFIRQSHDYLEKNCFDYTTSILFDV